MVYNNLYSFSDLLNIFPFGKTKLRQLLHAGVLPVVKVGRQYVTSDAAIQRWILENPGRKSYSNFLPQYADGS